MGGQESWPGIIGSSPWWGWLHSRIEFPLSAMVGEFCNSGRNKNRTAFSEKHSTPKINTQKNSLQTLRSKMQYIYLNMRDCFL